MSQKAFIDELTKKLIDDGRLIEAGWQGLRIFALPQNASEIQVTEMRKAFFAGAQHLYTSTRSTAFNTTIATQEIT